MGQKHTVRGSSRTSLRNTALWELVGCILWGWWPPPLCFTDLEAFLFFPQLRCQHSKNDWSSSACKGWSYSYWTLHILGFFHYPQSSNQLNLEFLHNHIVFRCTAAGAYKLRTISEPSWCSNQRWFFFSWFHNTTQLVKKSRQHLNYRKRLKLPGRILSKFCWDIIKIYFTSIITVWFGNCSLLDRKSL